MSYQEFHQLKNEMINKLTSIEDESCMDDWCNDYTTNIPVQEQVIKIAEMANRLKKLGIELAKIEE